jgi:diacylglycerol kinase family enzyme
MSVLNHDPLQQPKTEESPASTLTTRTVRVLVNARAGSVLQQGANAFSAKITDAFAKSGTEATVSMVSAAELARMLHRANQASSGLTILAGGDGTISGLLPEMLKSRRHFGILPLGTMNLLGRDLGLSGNPEQDAQMLAQGKLRWIDLAVANGKYFHSIAGLGFFAMMARERENARALFPFSKALGFLWAGAKTVLSSRTILVDLEIDDIAVTVEADAVLVTNNHFDGNPWSRARLDAGSLEVHVLQAKGYRGRIQAVLAVIAGRWRQLPTLKTYQTTHLTLTRRRKRRSTVAMDGELRRLENPIVFRIEPAALGVIAPAQT